MAEANQPVPAGASQADNTAAINGATGQQSGSGEPAWLNHIPAEHREEAKKSYMFEADYRKKTSELAEQRKSWEEKEKQYAEKDKNWDEFNKQYQPFRQQLERNWDKIAPILQGMQQQAQQQVQQSQAQDPFENYDLLGPREQAQRLAEHLKSQLVQDYDKRFTDYRQEIAKEISTHSGAFKNYLAVLTDAFDKKTANPELDMKAYLQKALEYQNGNINPLEAAFSAVTAEATQKRQQEEWLKKGAEEERLRMQNQQQPTGAIRNSMIPTFSAKPLNRQQVSEAVRADSIKAGRTW